MWSLKGKELYYAININDGRKSHIGKIEFDKEYQKTWKVLLSLYLQDNIETLHRELQKDKQELQDKISSRIAGLLSPPLPPEYTNPTNTSQLRLDISAIINEEFRKFEERMNERFGKE